MESTNIIKDVSKILWSSRTRILSKSPFFAGILYDLHFYFSKDEDLISSDGKGIYINPVPFAKFTDKEVDICLLHELMHIVLKHHLRRDNRNRLSLYRLACDMVVNSNIIHMLNSVYSNELIVNGMKLPHLTPANEEAYLYSVEEVYEMLVKAYPGLIPLMDGDYEDDDSIKLNKSERKLSNKPILDQQEYLSMFDSHSRWNKDTGKDSNFSEEDEITNKIVKGVEIAKMLNNDNIPKFARDLVYAMKNPKIDWRELLNDYLQENIVDYSFTPSDKRFPDSEFILPDFNDREFIPQNLIFMIDMSNSMTENMVMDCLAEIKGVIEQYNGKLIGYVGLFDTEVEKFDLIENFDESFLDEVTGKGGTSFSCIFKFLNNDVELVGETIKLVILTDGFCTYPEEKDCKRFDTIWIINNEEATPPWGKIVRIIK